MRTIKKYSRKHIGKKFTSNEGYSLEVVDGGTKIGYCTVLIDGKYEIEKHYYCIKKGEIKNVYHPSVCGIGYIGIGDVTTRENGKSTKQYVTWSAMIKRVYDAKHRERYPAYEDATVCEPWHNFQNFAKWFAENHIDGYELDKDLLSNDKKIYSPETCIFIPCCLNAFLTNNKSDNTSGHAGVHWNKKSGKYEAQISNGEGKQIHLGFFKTKEEASEAYQAQRSIYAKVWQSKMQGILPNHAIERIS